MLSLFRDSAGGIYWPSVLTFTGWAIAGAIMFVGFYISKIDRDRSHRDKEKLKLDVPPKVMQNLLDFRAPCSMNNAEY
jgi:hypothetical protein